MVIGMTNEDMLENIKGELIVPEHESPHGVDDLPPNDYRVWICEECKHIFLDKEIREDITKGWAHSCKHHPCRKEQRCESHLEPFLPELNGAINKQVITDPFND